jgi:hypothetical protein
MKLCLPSPSTNPPTFHCLSKWLGKDRLSSSQVMTCPFSLALGPALEGPPLAYEPPVQYHSKQCAL